MEVIDRNLINHKSIQRVYCVGDVTGLLSTISCSTLDSVRRPIISCISIAYKNLIGEVFDQLNSNFKLQIMIDCSLLLICGSAGKRKIKIQDL